MQSACILLGLKRAAETGHILASSLRGRFRSQYTGSTAGQAGGAASLREDIGSAVSSNLSGDAFAWPKPGTSPELGLVVAWHSLALVNGSLKRE